MTAYPSYLDLRHILLRSCRYKTSAKGVRSKVALEPDLLYRALENPCNVPPINTPGRQRWLERSAPQAKGSELSTEGVAGRLERR